MAKRKQYLFFFLNGISITLTWYQSFNSNVLGLLFTEENKYEASTDPSIILNGNRKMLVLLGTGIVKRKYC